jgi:putative flippase GtrA
MSHFKRLISFRFTRFALAGVVNTSVSFAVLNLMFYGFHLSKLPSIVIATACGIIISYALNRRFVFRVVHHSTKRFARFVAVAIFGVFLIQNSVFALTILLLNNHVGNFAAINLGNAAGSLAVSFWNYHGYRLAVFNQPPT